MWPFSLNNQPFKKIFYVLLLHIICVFFLRIYSSKTENTNKKSKLVKEHFTKLTKNDPNNYLENFSKPSMSSQKNIIKPIQTKPLSQVSLNTPTKKPSSQTNIPSNKTDKTLASSTKYKKKVAEIKNKFKELSEKVVSQLDAFESSSKQIDSLYEDTNNYKDIINLKISSSSYEENNNLLDMDIINVLQKFLSLPENQEDIIVLLSLSPKGDVLSLKIEKSNSIKNSEYCIKEIPKLPFQDALYKHNLTQSILFRIKLTT